MINSDMFIGAILGTIVADVWTYLKLEYGDSMPIKKLMKNKIVNMLWLILVYALPLFIIALSIIENNFEMTFRNIAFFIIMCFSLLYNLLIHHIVKIYRMLIELTSKASHNDETHKEAINLLLKLSNRTERIE